MRDDRDGMGRGKPEPAGEKEHPSATGFPLDAEPLISLEIRRRDRKGRWVNMLYTYPIRVAQLGNRFYICKPSPSLSQPARVTEINADDYPAYIERFETASGVAVVLTIHDL